MACLDIVTRSAQKAVRSADGVSAPQMRTHALHYSLSAYTRVLCQLFTTDVADTRCHLTQPLSRLNLTIITYLRIIKLV